MSKFYGIGVGPGDSDLLTLKAVKTLKNLDVIYSPEPKRGSGSFALSICRGHLPKGIVIKERHFPMTNDEEEKRNVWERISNEIYNDVVEHGYNVGFLTLGDSMIYSTYIYLLQYLKGKLEVETIPGISSFSSIASSNNYPLAVDIDELVIVPCNIDIERIRKSLEAYNSIVLMKVSAKFAEIYNLLEELELLDCAIMVSNSSLETEAVYRSLKDMRAVDRIPYFSTILINKRHIK